MEKSGGGIVAVRPANKWQPAEQEDPRPSPEGKAQDSRTHHAQQWAHVHQGIERLGEFIQRNPKYITLLHHISEDSLRAAFFALKRDASPGVDQVTWEAYEADVDQRISDLCTHMHRRSFRATPSRRVHIPKPDGTRPLEIAALEDKIVQTVYRDTGMQKM